MTSNTLPDTKFQRWLAAKYACTSGRMYVGDRTFSQFWDECTEHPDWMLWVAGRAAGVPPARIVLITCAFAERAQMYAVPGSEAAITGVEAIRLARAWCRGEPTGRQLRDAADRLRAAAVAAIDANANAANAAASSFRVVDSARVVAAAYAAAAVAAICAAEAAINAANAAASSFRVVDSARVVAAAIAANASLRVVDSAHVVAYVSASASDAYVSAAARAATHASVSERRSHCDIIRALLPRATRSSRSRVQDTLRFERRDIEKLPPEQPQGVIERAWRPGEERGMRFTDCGERKIAVIKELLNNSAYSLVEAKRIVEGEGTLWVNKAKVAALCALGAELQEIK